MLFFNHGALVNPFGTSLQELVVASFAISHAVSTRTVVGVLSLCREAADGDNGAVAS